MLQKEIIHELIIQKGYKLIGQGPIWNFKLSEDNQLEEYKFVKYERDSYANGLAFECEKVVCVFVSNDGLVNATGCCYVRDSSIDPNNLKTITIIMNQAIFDAKELMRNYAAINKYKRENN